MPIRVALEHLTTYTYDKLIQLGHKPFACGCVPYPNGAQLCMQVMPKDHFCNGTGSRWQLFINAGFP